LREALQLFWSVADRFAKRRLLLAFLLVAGGALLSALTPIALKLVVDELAPTGTAPLVIAPAALVLVYVFGQYLTRIFNELRTFAFALGEQRVRRQIGRRLFEHLVHLPMRFHLERKTGAMGETAEQGMRGFQLVLNHSVFTVLPVVIEFVAVAAVLVHYDHAIYLAILGAASIGYVLAFQRGAADVQGPARQVSDSHIEAHAVLTDSLLNYETVKYFDAEPVVCNRYDTALGRAESAWNQFFRRRAINGLLVATIFAGSLGVSLVYAAQDVARGAMTLGGFVLVNTYVIRLVQPLEMLGFAVRDISQGLAFLERLFALFRIRREPERLSAAARSIGARVSTDAQPALDRAAEAKPAGSELAFENVSFSYRPDRVVLNNVSFHASVGKTVAIVGVSGSGKSSLIRLLFRLYEPDSGKILLDGAPIDELPLSVVRQAIAVVPQDTVLFHDTLAKNIGFGRWGATQEDIQEAARVANLDTLIASLPDGYDTIVGERGLKLSGGERQRVAIARAALKRPRIFVFDEATSSLDSNTEREILTNLIDVASKCTTLVIAHRLSTIVHADEILVLHDGVIVERGTHAELRDTGGWYASLWNAQSKERVKNNN
jgi:ATP-binding cassette subfamily B protein